MYRWEAPLFFANAGSFRQQIRKLVRDRQPRWVVLQCEAITDVDVTAAEMLEQLDNELNAAGVHMAFAELRSRLQELTLRYGLMETLDSEHFYPTLEAAIEDIREMDAVLGARRLILRRRPGARRSPIVAACASSSEHRFAARMGPSASSPIS